MDRRRVFFFYGLDNPPYDPAQLARGVEFPRPEYWDEVMEGVDYSVLLDPQWEGFSEDLESVGDFLAELDQRWHAAGDPVCIGFYDDDSNPLRLYLAIYATRCLTDSDLNFANFDLPNPIDRAAWDRLLRAKCEILGIPWQPPAFHLLQILRPYPKFKNPPEVDYR